MILLVVLLMVELSSAGLLKSVSSICHLSSSLTFARENEWLLPFSEVVDKGLPGRLMFPFERAGVGCFVPACAFNSPNLKQNRGSLEMRGYDVVR